MRKIILQVAISLDGYIEDKNGSFDWCFDDGQDYGMMDFLKTIDTIIMGRKTYDLMKSMPINPDDPFTKSLSHINQFVFTRNKDVEPTGDITFISEDHFSWLKNYKDTPGKNIWLFGGADFTQALLNNNLVDQMMLAVHPILLGGGKKFNESQIDRIKLKLNSTKSYESGLILLDYLVV